MKTAEKYIGQVINGLTVLEYSHTKHYSCKSKHYFFLFRCHCGNEKVLNLQDVRRGASTSCGCRRVTEAVEKVAGMRQLFNVYKGGAKKRNYPFELTLEQFRELTSQICHYCKIPPSQTIKSWSEYSVYTYNGLDRVDNSSGYTLENTVPCCKDCNRAKSDMTYEAFMAWITRLKAA